MRRSFPQHERDGDKKDEKKNVVDEEKLSGQENTVTRIILSGVAIVREQKSLRARDAKTSEKNIGGGAQNIRGQNCSSHIFR